MVANPLEQIALADLRQRTSIKWQYFGPDVIPLWVAEMDVTPADAIQRAVERAMRSGDTGYTWGTAYGEAAARFSDARWGFTPDAARSLTVSDVMVGVFELIRLLTEPGGEVIVTSPVYPPFYGYATHAERAVREAPLTADHRIDTAAIDAACAAATAGGRTAVLLLANPHNPTGTVHTREELRAAAEAAARHGVRVIADEIHAPLVYEPSNYTPYLSVDPHGFSVFSASKGWNLAGLRSAVIFAGAEADDLERMPEVVTHGPNHVAVQAHVAALDEGRGWLDALLVALDAGRHRVAALLTEHAPAIRYRVPDATYLAWLDCRDTPHARPDAVADPGFVGLQAGPARAFGTLAGVGVNAGEAFGTGGENHVRLNFATRRDVLEEAIARIGAIC